MNISFLAIGNELVSGKIQETNARWLASQLLVMGEQIKFILLAPDNENELIKAFKFLEANSDIIICSGGLGPTPDDLTAQAFARYAGLELILNKEILDQIKSRFKLLRGMEMPPTNEKQAMFPKGAKIIPNPVGTAPGFELELNSRHWFFLPGVPNEFQNMCEQYLLARIRALLKKEKIYLSKTLRVLD